MLKAKNAAAGLLAGRMYTCRELAERLRRKGFAEENVQQTVEEFMSAGYLNDRSYAELYIEDAIKLGAKGMFRIRRELLQKGISPSIIEDAVAETEADSASALEEYVRQRNLCDGIQNRKDLEKLKARLVRRGYSMDEIQQCLSAYDFPFDR